MVNYPICLSRGAATCLDVMSLTPAPGYFCKEDMCYKCTTGSYGTDGKNCFPCPFATWSPNEGSTFCGTSFTYGTPGLVKSYIPYGVTKIIVQVWGGGGGSDNSLDFLYVSHSGGGGGYASCNLTVPMSNPIYVIVAGGGGAGAGRLESNAGGFGGGGRGYPVTGYSPGGGGGRSAVQVVLGVDGLTAGGGGGGADCFKLTGCGGGGGGGLVGRQASDPASGRAANSTSGGEAGKGFYCSGTAGSKYLGGDGCRQGGTAVSAGGGGGYYGGGGGSAFGDGNPYSDPPIYDVGGGGGGGSSYGGGCDAGTFFTKPGFTGNSINSSNSGGISEHGYQSGVGVGGTPGGAIGGNGYVKVTFVADNSYKGITTYPTGSPSSRPSGHPSSRPSSRPTQPTALPTAPPTRARTFKPTRKPTPAVPSNSTPTRVPTTTTGAQSPTTPTRVPTTTTGAQSPTTPTAKPVNSVITTVVIPVVQALVGITWDTFQNSPYARLAFKNTVAISVGIMQGAFPNVTITGYITTYTRRTLVEATLSSATGVKVMYNIIFTFASSSALTSIGALTANVNTTLVAAVSSSSFSTMLTTQFLDVTDAAGSIDADVFAGVSTPTPTVSTAVVTVTTMSPTAAPAEGLSKSDEVNIIVGAVIGGFVFLLIVVATVCFIRGDCRPGVCLPSPQAPQTPQDPQSTPAYEPPHAPHDPEDPPAYEPPNAYEPPDAYETSDIPYSPNKPSAPELPGRVVEI